MVLEHFASEDEFLVFGGDAFVVSDLFFDLQNLVSGGYGGGGVDVELEEVASGLLDLYFHS